MMKVVMSIHFRQFPFMLTNRQLQRAILHARIDPISMGGQ